MKRISAWFDRHMKTRIALQLVLDGLPAFLLILPLAVGVLQLEGLLPDIVALNGFVSVGKAVLNDHAVNYRELVKKIPRDRLLAETDCEPDAGEDAQAPGIAEVAAKIGELTGVGESALADNAGEFVRSLSGGAGKAEK